MFVCILIRSRSHHIVNPCLKLTRVLDPWLSDLIKSGCGRWKLFQISKLVFCQGFKIEVCWRFWFWSVININFMELIGIFIPFIKPRWIILKKHATIYPATEWGTVSLYGNRLNWINSHIKPTPTNFETIHHTGRILHLIFAGDQFCFNDILKI